MSPDFDVAVVGTGPAGATAARVAAAAGARTVLLERAQVPRYKCCGGGLIGLSRAALVADVAPLIRESAHRITFSTNLAQRYTKTSHSGPVFQLVMRSDFDASLVDLAVAAGAELRCGTVVRSLSEDAGVVTLVTSSDPVTARVVVGADGASGRTGSYVGVQASQVDVGLEGEFPVPTARRNYWAGRVHIDWGPVPGSYAWVFPKGDLLTVGVIGPRASGDAMRRYYDDFVAYAGLAGVEPSTFSGHLTRCRDAGSALRRGRVIVAGDAAGLLEPWTREGISFALRSGSLAGTAAAAASRCASERDAEARLSSYADRVIETLGPEMDAGRVFLQAFSANRQAFHGFVASVPGGWRLFTRLVGGQTSLPEQLERRGVRMALAAVLAVSGKSRSRGRAAGR
ncbi:MAG: geranylgeranyl reductase family protein [Actinomycetota bacterium]